MQMYCFLPKIFPQIMCILRIDLLQVIVFVLDLYSDFGVRLLI